MATKNNESPETVDSLVEIRSADVPIMASEDVQALMAELASLKAEKLALSEQISVPRGAAMPEPADEFVAAEDYDVRLDRYNDPQVTQEARRTGKLGFERSRISHKNYAPGMGSGYEASAQEARADIPAKTVWMYDDGGWARRIQTQALSSALQSGLHASCPLCHGRHKESETNPNICPKRKRVSYTICSICQASGSLRYIWDTQESAQLDDKGKPIGIPGAKATDEHMITLNIPSNPASRLQVRLNQHISVYHRATAATLRIKSADDEQ